MSLAGAASSDRSVGVSHAHLRCSLRCFCCCSCRGTALAQLDKRGAIVLCERLSRAQVEVRLATMAPYLVGMEVCNEALGSS